MTTRHDSPIGKGLEAVDRIRVSLKDFTAPSAAESFAPDAERIVPTPRHDSPIGESLEAADPTPCVQSRLHYSKCS